MPPFLYDLYWLLVFSIVLILSMILVFGAMVVAHRLYKNKYYQKWDQHRQNFAPFVADLREGKAIPEELKWPLKSIEWTVIEELFLNQLGNFASPPNEHLLGAFEQLGYVDWYIGQVNDGNRWQQAAAAEKLGQMRSPKAAEALIAALESPYMNVQTAAVQALGNIGGLKAAESLTGKLYTMTDANQGISLRVLKSALITFGSMAIPYLQNGLRHESWRVRGAVVDILSEIADPECSQDLRPLLRDPEHDVRAKAARALGRIKDADAVSSYIELLNDPSWVVRLQATRALENFSHPDAMEPLLQRMGDENWQVRAVAAAAVRRYGMRSCELLLKAITDNSDNYAREQLLEEIQRSGLLETYIDALGEPKSDETGGPYSIISKYYQHGTINLLLHLMKKHSNATVRRRLLCLFGKYKPPLALKDIRWLSNHDPDKQVRQVGEEILRNWVEEQYHVQETDVRSNQ